MKLCDLSFADLMALKEYLLRMDTYHKNLMQYHESGIYSTKWITVDREIQNRIEGIEFN